MHITLHGMPARGRKFLCKPYTHPLQRDRKSYGPSTDASSVSQRRLELCSTRHGAVHGHTRWEQRALQHAALCPAPRLANHPHRRDRCALLPLRTDDRAGTVARAEMAHQINRHRPSAPDENKCKEQLPRHGSALLEKACVWGRSCGYPPGTSSQQKARVQPLPSHLEAGNRASERSRLVIGHSHRLSAGMRGGWPKRLRVGRLAQANCNTPAGKSGEMLQIKLRCACTWKALAAHWTTPLWWKDCFPLLEGTRRPYAPPIGTYEGIHGRHLSLSEHESARSAPGVAAGPGTTLAGRGGALSSLRATA